ncbi:MAG: YbaK/EbsC family protein [Anaerolineae bacterium]|nr:YbaK/EbsC family protein [Anaerolineae bacterium]
MQPLTPKHVQSALDATGLGIQVMTFEQSTSTSQEAADAIGTALGSIVKSIVFVVDEVQTVVVLTAGDQRVDDRKLAEHFGVARKKVKIASPEHCIRVVGYAPGGVPPLGHRTSGLVIMVDRSLSRFETLYGAAGSANTIFPIRYTALIQVTGGQVLDVIKD